MTDDNKPKDSASSAEVPDALEAAKTEPHRGIPKEIPRANAEPIPLPVEIGKTTPVEPAKHETIPIVVAPTLPSSPLAVPATPGDRAREHAARKHAGHGDSEPTVVDPLLAGGSRPGSDAKLAGSPKRESEPKLAGAPKRDSEPNLEGIPRRADSEPKLPSRLQSAPAKPPTSGGSSSAAKPATGAGASSAAKPTTSAGASSAAKPATGAGASSAAKPTTGTGASSAAKPATDAGASSAAKPTTGAGASSAAKSATDVTSTGSHSFGGRRADSEPGVPKRLESEPGLSERLDSLFPSDSGVPNRRDSEPGLSERLDSLFPSEPGVRPESQPGVPRRLQSEPGVPRRLESEPGVPKRAESEPSHWGPPKATSATKPFQLPPREAARPDPSPLAPQTPTDSSTRPLEMPPREPAPSAPVTVALVEEHTGVLSPPVHKVPETKPFGIPARAPAPSAPVTIALVEENTGVLTPEPMKPVKPPPPATEPAPRRADTPIRVELVEQTTGVLSVPDTAADDIEESVTTEASDDRSDEDLVPWVAPEDGFMLADEIGDKPPPPPPSPNPPILPSPQEAALEAARIVSQMVDIESESGAMIAAAAAAGAAIEAAVAAQKASAAASGAVVDPRASQPSMRIPPELSGAQTAASDPITTVRLSRDRILAALADEDIAVPVSPSARESQPRMPAGEGARIRARTEPGIEDDAAYEDFDPVAIAAAAIGRLRQRARTDLAELRVHYHRHDILVLLLALVIIVAAGRVHQRMVTPPNEPFSERGLTFEHSSSWLKPEVMPPIAPRLVRDPTGAATKPDPNLYHVEFSAVGSTAKLEVLIDKKPTWSNIVTGLDLDRRSRWGELYTLDASSVKSIAGHDWLRTAYRYAHAEKGDLPRVDHAVEYATIDREQIYVVTVYGTPEEIDQIEDVVAPSLRVPSQTGLPLVPQTSRLSQRKYPGPVGRAFDSTVMVVVADLVDGRLQARGGGSGVIVGGEGSILTNYHVIHDKDGRLHDVFVIGRFSAPDRAPQLQCAGRPSRSKLLRDLDLALIKCDMDLDGRAWSATSSGVWATLPEAKAADVKVGQRLWVLGYPDVGGGGLTLNVGEVEGWTGEDGAAGKDFIKTDASITHGNSGGPVIDDHGRLVGIASAFRTRVSATGAVIETAQVGLVRPLQAASALLNYAAAGWTPREGYTDVELTPTAVEAAAEGVRIFTTVIDDANEQPVRDATVMVLKPGVNTATIDMNRLDDQTIAWGKTNGQGEVRLKQLVPIPGTYTVMVVAPGYEPLIGENELHLDDNTPPSFDPWGKIGLRSR